MSNMMSFTDMLDERNSMWDRILEILIDIHAEVRIVALSVAIYGHSPSIDIH